MSKEEIQKLITELVRKTDVSVKEITITEDRPGNTWFSVEVGEPHFFTDRDGEGLHALNHVVRRILEKTAPLVAGEDNSPQVLIDINGFQKKHIDSVRAVAHMMSERARYFKANVEVDPMSAFERRIVHEFLSEEPDLKTESVGMGRTRRVVIKYVGAI